MEDEKVKSLNILNNEPIYQKSIKLYESELNNCREQNNILVRKHEQALEEIEVF